MPRATRERGDNPVNGSGLLDPAALSLFRRTPGVSGIVGPSFARRRWSSTPSTGPPGPGSSCGRSGRHGHAGGLYAADIGHTVGLEDKVREQTADLRRAQEEVICAVVSASRWSDDESEMHMRRVGLFSEVVARAAGWFGEEADAIRQAAPLHDLGKIGIPDEILRKPGKLTPEEFKAMKTDTLIGSDILANSKMPMLQMAHQIALYHHERWDGRGYPHGLEGEEIPESPASWPSSISTTR